MRRIFSKLLYEMEEKRDTMLVTIIANDGSAPRHAGAGMLVGERGRLVGTIGGGAVEYRAEQMALELLAQKTGAVHDFTLRPNTREDLGMQCGGDVTVLFEYVPGEDASWKELAGAVCNRIEQRESGWLIRPLTGGAPGLYGPDGHLAGSEIPAEKLSDLCRGFMVVQGDYAGEPLPQYGRTLIFGGGHIAQALVPMLAATDFHTFVFDDRPDYSRPELFPGAEGVVTCDFDKLADYVTFSSEDYIVIMTNGHAHDMSVEEQVLRSPFAYIGVVGSRRKIAYVNSCLMEKGIPEETLHKVHTPIGLSIHAVTPAEIAVSILAELIKCRAEIRDGDDTTSQGCPMHICG